MLKKIYFSSFIIFLLVKQSLALSFIRDAQTEQYLNKIAKPIFIAANLENQIKLHVINDDNINAFVAAGKNIFINTGTITYADSPLGLIGIIAHETGHIAGSHLARMSHDMQKINVQMALGYIIGIATAAAGRADAGQAVIMGSSHIGERQFYKHSTKHEEAADEAALMLLEQSKISASGLLEFFKTLKTNEKLHINQINPYSRTHPLTNNRITRIEEHIENSQYKNKQATQAEIAEFLLIKTKLRAFLEDPQQIIETYDTDSENGKLANIIALHRLGNTDEALKLFESLKYKNDAFMQELKGQIEYESGRASEAVKTLLKVAEQKNDIALIKIELAAAIISAKKENLYNLAIDKLNQALIHEKENVYAWRNLSILYNLTEQNALSLLTLAEAEFFSANYELAIKYAQKAKKILTNNSSATIRAEDIIKFSEEKSDV